ncbi:MAG TPA: hypothetical protein VLB83_00325 [Candidatus Paceibacterota bacterium]|nr:hypothetical protein [Candidatus Paceibacterota bacterium]
MKKMSSLSGILAISASLLVSGCAAVGGAAGYALTEHASPGMQIFGVVSGAYLGGIFDAMQSEQAYQRQEAARITREATGSTPCSWRTRGWTSPSGQDYSDGGEWECSGSNVRPGRHGTPPAMYVPVTR